MMAVGTGDAQIVALCREHGVETLLTEDRGFSRFPSIRVVHLDRVRAKPDSHLGDREPLAIPV